MDREKRDTNWKPLFIFDPCLVFGAYTYNIQYQRNPFFQLDMSNILMVEVLEFCISANLDLFKAIFYGLHHGIHHH